MVVVSTGKRGASGARCGGQPQPWSAEYCALTNPAARPPSSVAGQPPCFLQQQQHVTGITSAWFISSMTFMPPILPHGAGALAFAAAIIAASLQRLRWRRQRETADPGGRESTASSGLKLGMRHSSASSGTMPAATGSSGGGGSSDDEHRRSNPPMG